jgi:SAM-dependent methyltransferase
MHNRSFFTDLAERISDICEDVLIDSPAPTVVEPGGGTGFYANAIVERFNTALALSFDISAHAAKVCARQSERVASVVADVWQRWPIGDNSADVVLSIFSPRNVVETERVMKTGSVLIVVTPEDHHLVELRTKFNALGIERDKSEKISNKFYVEVEIERQPFINEQKERVVFIEKKINGLDKNSQGKNPIQRRNSLIKINELAKELELKSMIIRGSGEVFDLKDKLALIAKFQNELEKSSDKIEFFFDLGSPKEIVQIIRSALNKEKLKITNKLNKNDDNQVIIKIENFSKTNHIYEAHMTKTKIDFENLSQGKILASNSIEVAGSSTISEKESYNASLKSLEEKIEKDGVLKVLGILN